MKKFDKIRLALKENKSKDEYLTLVNNELREHGLCDDYLDMKDLTEDIFLIFKDKCMVSVKEALPQEDKMVLCFCEEEPIVKYDIASCYNGMFIDYDEYPVEATHWMYLPSAPKG